MVIHWFFKILSGQQHTMRFIFSTMSLSMKMFILASTLMLDTGRIYMN